MLPTKIKYFHSFTLELQLTRSKLVSLLTLVDARVAAVQLTIAAYVLLDIHDFFIVFAHQPGVSLDTLVEVDAKVASCCGGAVLFDVG